MSFPLLSVPLTLLLFATSFKQVFNQVLDPHGPPKVDTNPMFLDSFVPAGLQLISHVTELMKYELPTTEIPTTIPPSTSSHRPGIFAPSNIQQSILNRPPSFYYRLGEQPQENTNLGNTYKSWVYSTRRTGRQSNNKIDYFGKIHSELYDKVNNINEDKVNNINEDKENELTDQEKVDRFLRDYDDENLDENVQFLRKKKPPPPKAYVTLLSLYDSLNKEAKKLGMNKYAGYTQNVLEDLVEFSKGTSANQMKEIFTKIVERKEVKQENLLKALRNVINDLEEPKSYINDALRYIPPLIFENPF